jgi:glycosyltransferase involved in cell wall biosynthesis
MSLAIGLANLKPAEGTTSAKVTVVTRTSRGAFQDESLPFQVVRQPSLRQMVSLIRATDVIHLAGPAMLPLLAALLLRKPAVVEHHGFQSICPNGQLLYEPTQKACPGHFMAGRHMNCLRCNSKNSLLRSINMWLLTFPRRWMCMRASANISPTDWLAAMLNLPRTTTIHHGVGRVAAGSVPTFPPSHATFAFIGRLVSTKGVESLLEAAQQLHAEGFRFRLKVIGDGPDRE